MTSLMRPNRVRATLQAGGTAYGTMAFEFFSPGLMTILAGAGADFVLLDTEHSGIGIEIIKTQIAASRGLGIVPMVRVPGCHYHLIAPVLDAGATGIMVPMVETAAQAQRIAEHRGGCHCGNLVLHLRLSQAPEDTPLRACSCTFCRAHNTRTTSDPHGSVEIWAKDWSFVEPYRFGSRTAEFLICRRCGVYVGAVCETAAGIRAVINVNCLDDRAAFTRQPTPVDHEGEATVDRLARRAANWTPAKLHR